MYILARFWRHTGIWNFLMNIVFPKEANLEFSWISSEKKKCKSKLLYLAERIEPWHFLKKNLTFLFVSHQLQTSKHSLLFKTCSSMLSLICDIPHLTNTICSSSLEIHFTQHFTVIYQHAKKKNQQHVQQFEWLHWQAVSPLASRILNLLSYNSSGIWWALSYFCHFWKIGLDVWTCLFRSTVTAWESFDPWT